MTKKEARLFQSGQYAAETNWNWHGLSLKNFLKKTTFKDKFYLEGVKYFYENSNSYQKFLNNK